MENIRVTNEYKVAVTDTDGFPFTLYYWVDTEADAVREALADLSRNNLQPKKINVELEKSNILVEMV